MFKKSKPKTKPPPTAPTVDEILADMETFEVQQPQVATNSDNSDLEHELLTEPENLPLQTWWQVFDAYDQKVTKLAATIDTLESQKEKLQSCCAKLEQNAQELREGIQKQQSLIKKAVN
ncbi:uncharacterized protein LOC117897728 [Drosophila subobscura]|uniref:uncharacterized protein LOC117897728 n=1 Tax=Drosophila subobscura TaxID=7241 RepID=UPI00155B2C31|nr:uncharacterized protein LOC117897728 [Drosophila subobscura]